MEYLYLYNPVSFPTPVAAGSGLLGPVGEPGRTGIRRRQKAMLVGQMADTLKEILMTRSTVAQARNERAGVPAKSNWVVLQMTPEHLEAVEKLAIDF